VWARLARLGAAEDDPATWATADVTGLSKAIKRDAAFAALGSPVVVRGAVDDLLGRGAWDPPREWGTIMLTFPGQARPWLLPARSWHADYGWDFYPEPLFGVKVFAFVAEVGPRGGGTLVITGSHRVTARFATALPQGQPFAGHLLHRYLRGDEWFRALTRPGDDDPGRAARFMDADHDADGIPVRVAELTGQPGDVVLAHPWVLHSHSPNAGGYPRIMLTKNLFRRGCFGGGYPGGPGPADG
jgi:hypothetical protein